MTVASQCGFIYIPRCMGARSEEIGKPREAGNSSDKKSETGDIQAAVKERQRRLRKYFIATDEQAVK